METETKTPNPATVVAVAQQPAVQAVMARGEWHVAALMVRTQAGVNMTVAHAAVELVRACQAGAR